MYIIQKTVTNNKESYSNNLYNFPHVNDARKRLQSILNLCKCRIIESNKNHFVAVKYEETNCESTLKFEVLKQK